MGSPGCNRGEWGGGGAGQKEKRGGQKESPMALKVILGAGSTYRWWKRTGKQDREATVAGIGGGGVDSGGEELRALSFIHIS